VSMLAMVLLLLLQFGDLINVVAVAVVVRCGGDRRPTTMRSQHSAVAAVASGCGCGRGATVEQSRVVAFVIAKRSWLATTW
jgi:hypothetical protein